MDTDGAQAGDCKNFLGNDLGIGGDDEEIRVNLKQLIANRNWVFRLENFNLTLTTNNELFCGWGSDNFFASNWSIGITYNYFGNIAMVN
ncbi:MAG: hypothetical protein G01um101420_958 [Parcubacteria group bacterium Gr01-1014_20]|nr:MAG: hypothetical protein G01um101420_958 [Parcubacteria group bacterium Gr01-1014_20]